MEKFATIGKDAPKNPSKYEALLLNKTKTSAMAATTSGAKVEQGVYSVLQGIDATKYSVTINSTT